MLPKPDQARGENDIGVELRADTPALRIPGKEIVYVQAVDKQQIGENGMRRFLRGAERRCRRDRRGCRSQDQKQFEGDGNRQHYEMERIEPTQSQQEKPSHSEAVEHSLLVIRGDDEAAQHKKEIDEKVGVAHERHMQMAVGGVAVDIDQALEMM